MDHRDVYLGQELQNWLFFKLGQPIMAFLFDQCTAHYSAIRHTILRMPHAAFEFRFENIACQPATLASSR